jgi:GT2 family glycosyltransferase
VRRRAARNQNLMNLLAVVVLYKQTLEQSQTLTSLGDAFKIRPELLRSIRVVLWDNGPAALADLTLAFPFDYFHSGKNAGTSGAFNRAMELAETMAIPWLLLLDQDTTLPEGFLPRMMEYGDCVAGDPEVAAVVPMLWCRGKLISPQRLGRFYRVLPLPVGCHGIYKKQVIACDSATLMRVTALREAGGYDEDLFWLDFSDIHVFAALHRNGKSIYVASDVQLLHSLAIMDYENDMTPERYRNFLAAEGAFLLLNKSTVENAALTIRLAARAIKQYLRYKNKAFARLTWRAFCSRLFVAKAQRMKYWENELRSRTLPLVSGGHAQTP